MMVHFRLIAVLLIGGIQVSTAKPIVPGQVTDPAKFFSADELQRAKDAGISDRHLISGKEFGFTLDEMIQLHSLFGSAKLKDKSIEFTTKICEILAPGHKVASNLTKAHEVQLKKIMKMVSSLPDEEELPFIRTSVCSFVSRPDSFDPKLIQQTKLRSIQKKAENATGAARVQLAREMCCVDGGGDILDPTSVCGFNESQIKEFDTRWSDYEATNGWDSFRKVCEFLEAKNPIEEECLVEISTDESTADST